MWRHTQEYHGGTIGEDSGRRDYEFRVVSSFKDSFTRIIDESVRLNREERGVEMTSGKGRYVCQNKKGEYFVTKEIRPEFVQL